MQHKRTLRAALAAGFLLAAGAAMANPSNVGPPSGTPILDLNGQATPSVYTNYTANFTATAAATNLSFALRDDPWFISLDAVTVTDLTTATAVTVVNGGFEDGVVGQNAPLGWTYLNNFGATVPGVVANNTPGLNGGGAFEGSNYYVDGAVQAYDGITQSLATTAGDLYQVSFWLDANGSGSTFSQFSTNGNVTDTGGNGVDLLVYAGAVPTVQGGVPEPASWALMTLGFMGMGGALRARRRSLAAA